LLHIYGLIPKENEGLVPYAIRMLNALDPVGGGKPKQREAAWRATQLLRDTFISSPCEPWFVGCGIQCLLLDGWEIGFPYPILRLYRTIKSGAMRSQLTRDAASSNLSFGSPAQMRK